MTNRITLYDPANDCDWRSPPLACAERRHKPVKWRYVLAFLLGLLAGRAFGQSPASECHAALMDAKQLPSAAGVQYFSLIDIDPKLRDKAAKVLSWQLNMLSRVRVITPIGQDDYVSDTLIRVRLSDYAVEAKDFAEWYAAMQRLGSHNYVFHFRTEVLAHGKRFNKTVDGGWVLEPQRKLAALTGSQVPVMPAGFFISGASHPPYYHDLAGLPPKLADMFKVFGINQKELEKLRVPVGANLFISGITKKNRQLQWLQGPFGGVYFSLDVAKSTAERSPIRRPLNAFGTNYVFDASEWFLMGHNGMWRMYLADAQGNRQDSVPDAIAKDDSDPHGPGIVYPMASCIRCHVEGGLRPFRDDQQDLIRGDGQAIAYDANALLRLHEFYDDSKFQRQMAFDRATYEAACVKACGLKPKEVAAAFAEVLQWYSYLPVTIERAAMECGVSVDEFKFALNESRDGYVIALKAGKSITKGDWASSAAEAQLSCAAQIRRDGK